MQKSNLKWITNDWGLVDEHAEFERQGAIYFRKEFVLESIPTRATLTVYSNGITNVYMNGGDVGGEYLAPGPSEFIKSLSFRTYDATRFIRKNNALLIIAGDGWYCGEYTQRYRANLVHGVKIAIELTLAYSDGRVEVITTDNSWQTLRGAIGLNDIYHGEEFDARLPHVEYSEFGYPCENAEMAKFTTPHVTEFNEYDVEPVRKISEIKPTKLKKSKTGGVIYDFGQNFSGVIQIKVKGERGERVIMRHGEVLTISGDELFTENLRVAKATDIYTLSGEKTETYIPTTTYHGFRFAEITYDESKVKLISVKGIVLHTDLKQAGEFTSNNALVNKIYSCALWGAKSNLFCIPTDCPQRNERFGWLADAQVFTKTAVNMFDCRKFYDFYLRLIENGTLEGGNVPVFVPRIPGIGAAESVFGWSDACIIIPHVLYLYYGDKTVIEKFAPLMKSYMGFCKKREPGYLQNAMKYGDWLNAGQETDQGLIATAYYANSAKLLSYMLSEIGDSESAYYLELFQNIKSAFRKEYWDEEKSRFTLPSQTAYALGVSFGLIEPEEAKEGFIEELEKFDYRIMCGFMGANLMLPALCDCGLKDVACKLLLNEVYPSWGYCINNGATTFWEHWNAFDAENNTYVDPAMNSFNHYSFGSCVEMFYTHFLGIIPTKPAFKKVRIKPFIPCDSRLTKVKGSYTTPFGKISVAWRVKGKVAEIKITKPSKVLAEFVFDKVIFIKQDGKIVSDFNATATKTCVKILLDGQNN